MAIELSHEWEAVECGIDEWFLAKPDGDGGYTPYYDAGCIPGDLMKRIALCLNCLEGVEDETLEYGNLKLAIQDWVAARRKACQQANKSN
jgi:hypothetical protein